MNPDEALRIFLRADTGLTNLIGENKIFVIKAPDTTQMPFIVINDVDGDSRALTMCIQNSGETLIQLTIKTKGKDEGYQVNQIADYLRNKLRFYRGAVGSIQSFFIRWNGLDIYGDSEDMDAIYGIARITMEYTR